MPRRRAVVALLLVAAAACTTTTPGERLEPLVVGWQQFFDVTAELGRHRGRPVVDGYVTNTWGMPATNVRLLVEGLDQAGTVVSQDVVWLGTSLAPGRSAYYRAPAPPAADQARVRVFAFDWVQAGGGIRRQRF